MGLDAVELIMAVEEAFDMEIPDQEAVKLNTVGQMYAYVVSRLAFSQRDRCISSAVFYRTRRALMDLYALQRRSITPSTRMETLLPSGQRRSHWESLGRAMEAQLPSLEHPEWISKLFGSLGLSLLIPCLAAYFVYAFSMAVLYSLGSAALVWATHRAVATFAVQLPAECATVGGTVRAVLRVNDVSRTPTGRKWDPNEVWETLRGVVVEQFGVPPEAVTAETHFVNDLGAG
jgi:acyl carrier protein